MHRRSLELVSGSTKSPTLITVMEPSIGNVKGVMLCARPDAVDHNTHAAKPFYSAVRAPEKPGYPPNKVTAPIEREHVPSVTELHKAFLAEMLQQKDEIVASMLAQQAAVEEKAASVKLHGAQIRARIRGRTAEQAAELPTLPPSAFKTHSSSLRGLTTSMFRETRTSTGSSVSSPALPRLDVSTPKSERSDLVAESGSNQCATEADADREVAKATITISQSNTELDVPNLPIAASPSNARKYPPRPAWALTAEQKEKMEEEEVDELLDFASDLNYEQYIEDIEVGETLKALHKRIAVLEDEKRARDASVAENRIRVERERLEREAREKAADLQILSRPSNTYSSSFSCASPVHFRDAEIAADEEARIFGSKEAASSAKEADELLMRLKGQANHLASRLVRDASSLHARNASPLLNRPSPAELAQMLLGQSRSMRAVHSSSSAAAIIQHENSQPQVVDSLGASDAVLAAAAQIRAERQAEREAESARSSAAPSVMPTPPRTPIHAHVARDLGMPPLQCAETPSKESAGPVRVGSRLAGKIVTVPGELKVMQTGTCIDNGDHGRADKIKTIDPDHLPYMYRHPGV